MKELIIFLAIIAVSHANFAQKAKANVPVTESTPVVVEYRCPMHPDVASDKPGKCSKCNMDLALSKKEQVKREVTHTYTCPMHQEVISQNPGKCEKCQAKLVIDRRGSKQGRTVYTCSMHPDIVSDKPGKCSKCNMDLTATEEKPKG